MKRRTVSISQAKAGLSELVHGVAFAGEEVVIAWHGKPRAVLVPVADRASTAEDERIASMRRALKMADALRKKLARRQKRLGIKPRPVVEQIREMRREWTRNLTGE